jgi:hypothetical protein
MKHMKRAIALLALLVSLLAWGQTVPYAPITQGQVWTPTQWAYAWGSKTDYPAPLTSLAAISGGTVIGNPGSTSAVPTAISGVVLGSPTGSSEGAGTLNAQGLYVQGVPVLVNGPNAVSVGNGQFQFSAANGNEPIQILSSTTANGSLISFNIEQELNHAGTASWDDFAQASEAFTPLTDTQNFTGQVVGVYGSVSHFGSGTMAYEVGGGFEAFNPGPSTGAVLIGVSATANNGGVAAGVPVQTPTNNGTAATVRGVDIAVKNYSSGAVTNGQGIYINSPQQLSTGTFTNIYGLEIEDQTLGTATNYAIYTNKGLVHFGDVAQLAPFTVSTLPTCGASNNGGMAYVTDAASPTYNGALTGGGAVSVPVFCNGSAWTAH